MGSKELPPEMRKAVAAEVEALIASYPRKSIRQIAELVDIPQGMLSTMRRGKGIGILALLKLRKVRKKSIDAMLGLVEPPRTVPPPSTDDKIASIVDAAIERALAARAEKAASEPAPPPPPRTTRRPKKRS